MISRISFIFSFFWAHEVPILPLTLFFENRLDWIESLWLLSLPCSALSRHLPCRPPPHPAAQSAAASIPKSLPGAPASGERGLLQRVCSGRAGGGAPAGGSCPWRSCRGGGLQPACRRRGRATWRGARCHNPETTGGKEDNRLSPDKFSRCRRRDRRDVRWNCHRRQG